MWTLSCWCCPSLAGTEQGRQELWDQVGAALHPPAPPLPPLPTGTVKPQLSVGASSKTRERGTIKENWLHLLRVSQPPLFLSSQWFGSSPEWVTQTAPAAACCAGEAVPGRDVSPGHLVPPLMTPDQWHGAWGRKWFNFHINGLHKYTKYSLSSKRVALIPSILQLREQQNAHALPLFHSCRPWNGENLTRLLFYVEKMQSWWNISLVGRALWLPW